MKYEILTAHHNGKKKKSVGPIFLIIISVMLIFDYYYFFYNRLFILISFTEHIKMLMTSRGTIVVMSLTFDMRYDMFNERHLNM